MNLTFFVTPEGLLPEGIRNTLKRVIPEFAGQKITLKIGLAKDKRSLNQNDFYWTVIVPHVRNFRLESGDPVSIDQTHEDLLSEFAPVVSARRINGACYIRPMRSKEMSVKEFSDYCTAIISTMASFGSPIETRDYA